MSKLLKIAMAISIASSFSALAFASAPRFTARVVLPYSVSWAGTQLPAGAYQLSCSAECNSGVLSVKAENDGQTFYVMGQRGDSAAGESSSLTINHYGKRSAVHVLHIAGDNVDFIFAQPKIDRRELEVKKPHSETIAVALNRSK
jgi:hypothetical protein